MVKEPGDNCKRPEGIRYIPCPSKTSIPRKERRHDFPYKNEIDRIEIDIIFFLYQTIHQCRLLYQIELLFHHQQAPSHCTFF